MNKWIVGVAAGGGAGRAGGALLRKEDASLPGQAVLITGGSRGLGLSLAREFAKRGCRIAICARDAAELGEARRDLARCGAEVLAIQCDVGDQSQVQAMAARALQHYGHVDVLVNN